MLKFPQKLIVSTVLLSCTLSVGIRPPAAYASLEQTLAPYSENTLGLLTLDLDLTKWNYLLQKLAKSGMSEAPSSDAPSQDDKQQKPGEIMELIEFLHKDMKFDPLHDGLGNLGSHLTLGYQHYANTDGQLLFSLNLKSPECAKDLIKRLNTSLAKREKATQMSEVNFGGKQIYSYKNIFKEGEVLDKNQIHLAISGANLIGTLGENQDLLKQMIYRQEVSPAGSAQKLQNQSPFTAVKNSVQAKPVWAYVNWQGLLELIDENKNPLTGQNKPMDELDLLREFVTLGSSMGLGFDVNKDGVQIKSFTAPDFKNMSPGQSAYFSSLSDKEIPDLNPLIQHMPGNPILTQLGQFPQSEAGNSFISNTLFKMLQKETGITEQKLSQTVKSILNVDYKNELLPALDGRVGFGLFESGKRMDMVMYLGVKKGQEKSFDNLMQNKFRFRTDSLESLDKLLTPNINPDGAVKANMHVIQTMAETYAVDWSGTYPKTIDILIKESQEKDYYQEIVNPVNQLVGKGKAFSDFKDFKADPALAGQVFWERENESSYTIYGYSPEGKLYAVSNGDVDFLQRDDLPKVEVVIEPTPIEETPDGPNTIIPKELENWNGIPIYHFPVEESLEALFKSTSEISDSITDAADSARTSSLKANMHTYQVILETYGVDWNGFPENAEVLFNEAEEQGYWHDIKNPVTGLSGANQAWTDVSKYTEDPELAGMIFYEPTGEKTKTEDGVFYESYAIFGYGPDGNLYRIDPESGMETVQSGLPIAENFEDASEDAIAESVEELRKAEAESLDEKPKEDPNPFKDLKLVFARKDNVWILAWNLDSLKAALAGNKPPQLQALIDDNKAQSANGIFYMDPQAGLKLLKELVPDLDSSTELKEIVEAIKPWKNAFSTTQHSSEGTETELWLNVDLDSIDFKGTSTFLNDVVSNFTSAQERAKKSSVKANMHTLQTMVEIYAIDWGGVYPRDMASLLAEAKEHDYLKIYHNPFNESGRASADYADYAAGKDAAGMVFYQPIERESPYDEGQKDVYEYKIFGTDGEGELIKDKEEVFYLSNS